jgi:hypothetical protein
MDCDCFYWTASLLVAGRLYDTAGSARVKEIPAYSGVAATRLYAVSITPSILYGATSRG